MILLLIRHGQTVGGEEHRYVGVTDESLSEAGIKNLLEKRESYADLPTPDAVYVTARIRTLESAQLLFPNLMPIRTEGLEEMDFGRFEGLGFADLEFDPDYRNWVENGCETACPGGESKDLFCSRVTAAFDRIVSRALEEGKSCIALVAHGGTWMAVMERFCQEKRTYFDWHISYGEGFVVKAPDWKNRKELILLKAVGEAPE